jgi:hypothetical protein
MREYNYADQLENSRYQVRTVEVRTVPAKVRKRSDLDRGAQNALARGRIVPRGNFLLRRDSRNPEGRNDLRNRLEEW